MKQYRQPLRGQCAALEDLHNIEIRETNDLLQALVNAISSYTIALEEGLITTYAPEEGVDETRYYMDMVAALDRAKKAGISPKLK